MTFYDASLWDFPQYRVKWVQMEVRALKVPWYVQKHLMIVLYSAAEIKRWIKEYKSKP